ncbi:hypothetical protein ACFX14_001194 [Malus domestica]
MSTTLSATRPGVKVCLVRMEHGAMTVPFTPAATKKGVVPDERAVTDAHHLRWVYNLPLQNFQSSNSTASGKSFMSGPTVTYKSQVVALLDDKSFSLPFDVSKVKKKYIFTGIYMPSLELIGDYRILSYLDPLEPKHR